VTDPQPGYTASGPQPSPEEPGVPFEDEVAAAVRKEQQISARLLLALAVVALVIGARLLFF
jgi:hypothetical protein